MKKKHYSNAELAVIDFNKYIEPYRVWIGTYITDDGIFRAKNGEISCRNYYNEKGMYGAYSLDGHIHFIER